VRRLAVVVLLTAALAGCGGKKASAPSLGTTNATTTVDSSGCHPIKTPYPQTRRAPKPKAALDPSKTYDVTLDTSCGSFTFRLDVKDSPHTTASFVSLVRRGYFLGTIFHRIVPGFVIQGGDPTGTGTSGPGYTTVDRPPKGTKYTEGTVAMAKTQSEPAGAAGSQFFVVIGPEAATLPPEYAVLGHVTKGLDVAKRIGTFGNANDPSGSPSRLVVIEKATVDVH
jgi:cyclophilin family peptidyl-prolyl cis-trans isomerase